MSDTFWTWELAKSLIDALESKLRDAGYGLGLTGSVLYRGKSEKDLDLIVFPLNALEGGDPISVREVLMTTGGRRLASKESVHIMWRMKGSSDTKHVEVWQFGQRRVDIFFLS